MPQRFMMVFDTHFYSTMIPMLRSLATASESLEAEGFILTVRKNSWDDAEYKGLNTRWLDSGKQLTIRDSIPYSGKLGRKAANS